VGNPSISVIVPAYNAEATLGDCLKALRNMTVEPVEVLVYVDGSTDGTEQIARDAGAQVLKNSGPPKGPALARNAAAAVANSDLLWFVDADVVVSPDCLRRLIDDMQANAAVAAFGSYDDKPASLRATSLYANLRHHYVHQRGNPDATTFWSGIGLMRRDIFLQFGGFDWERFPYPSVEDVELGMRVVAAGHRIRLVPSALGKHCKDWSLWRVWHTDVLRRARPWSLLLSERPDAAKDLNLAKEERARAFLALMIPTLLAGGLFSSAFLLLAAVTALLYGFVNRRFYSFLFRRLPMTAFAVAVAMHWCYHCYSALTYAWTMVQLRLGRVTAAVFGASLGAALPHGSSAPNS
jgi:glycosyltransferase involved in cell wall biosynthesis